MKNILINAVFLLWGVIAVAQVKIGGTDATPNPNAMLDVESDKKGFLPPRVKLQATNQADPLTSFTSAAGITVYNTASAGAGATAVSPGYYYNDGAKWIRLVNDAENGLHTQTGTVKLGGELTENTAITTGGATQTLAIENLVEIEVDERSDLDNQKIVVAHQTSGLLKTIDAKVYAPANNTTVYKAKVTSNGSLLNIDIGGGWQPVNFGVSTNTFHNGAIAPMNANGNLTIQESGIYAIGFYFRHGTGVQLSLLDLTGGGAGIRIVKNGNTASPLDLKLFSGANIALSDLFNDDGSLSLPVIGNLGLLDGLSSLPIVGGTIVAPIANTINSLTSTLQLSSLVNALVGNNLLHLIISTSELNSVYALQAGDVLSFQTRLGGLSATLLSSSEANLYLYKISEISD
jgi:hypothetical protein